MSEMDSMSEMERRSIAEAVAWGRYFQSCFTDCDDQKLAAIMTGASYELIRRKHRSREAGSTMRAWLQRVLSMIRMRVY